MMKILKQIILFIFACSILQINAAIAGEPGRFGERIFHFQKKLAMKGNTLAQYKLGTLYEFGVFVKPNVEEAKVWYKKASEKAYRPAINRLLFLEIKHTGYHKSRHADWFKNILADVDLSESNALIIFGQMHRYGIVVSKNLNKAVVFLERASSQGRTEVDFEIEEVNEEIAAHKAKREKRSKKISREKTVKAKPVKQVINKPVQKKSLLASKDRQKNKAARKQKYEEIMRKFYQDELAIQQQQQWSESAGDTEED
jgi:hypothetical protein